MFTVTYCHVYYNVSSKTFICTAKYTVHSKILGTDLTMTLTALFSRNKAGFSLLFLSWGFLFLVAVVHMLPCQYLSPHSLVNSTDTAVACHFHVRHTIPLLFSSDSCSPLSWTLHYTTYSTYINLQGC